MNWMVEQFQWQWQAYMMLMSLIFGTELYPSLFLPVSLEIVACLQAIASTLTALFVVLQYHEGILLLVSCHWDGLLMPSSFRFFHLPFRFEELDCRSRCLGFVLHHCHLVTSLHKRARLKSMYHPQAIKLKFRLEIHWYLL